MKTNRIIKKVTAFLLVAAALLLLSSCKGNLEKLELSSPLTEEERVYYTGQDFDTIVHDTERDNYMTAEEAKAYGLIDEVITHR